MQTLALVSVSQATKLRGRVNKHQQKQDLCNEEMLDIIDSFQPVASVLDVNY